MLYNVPDPNILTKKQEESLNAYDTDFDRYRNEFVNKNKDCDNKMKKFKLNQSTRM